MRKLIGWISLLFSILCFLNAASFTLGFILKSGIKGSIIFAPAFLAIGFLLADFSSSIHFSKLKLNWKTVVAISLGFFALTGILLFNGESISDNTITAVLIPKYIYTVVPFFLAIPVSRFFAVKEKNIKRS